MHAIHLQNLVKRIDGRLILRDVSLSIHQGDSVVLLGSNGAGKSTLLKLIVGMIPPTAGTIELFGQKTTRETIHVRKRIGFIGHQSMLYRDLSARENLTFFAKLYGVNDIKPRVDALLKQVGLIDRANDPPKAFSRGMTQRLSIARALVNDPDLLLADEPFAGLDERSSEGLEKLFAKLNEQGKTLVIVNHDIAQSLRIAKRAVILANGTVATDRPTVELDPSTVSAVVGMK